MKKFLFLLMSVAVLSASAGITKGTIQKSITKNDRGMAKVEQVVRKAAPGTVSTPYTVMIKGMRDEVPEGYASVTLTVGDVWGDGSGYQMLLDDDATAYGNEIPESGPLSSSGDVDATVYAAFEYKIPENADGSLSTSNIVMNNSVTILVPAGTYDWVITNPTPGDRMWVASAYGNVGGRFNDYVFKSRCSYTFTVSLGSNNYDQTDVVIDDPTAPVVPEITVTPTDKTAYVEWAPDANSTGWNLRWRPYTEGGDDILWDFPVDDLSWLNEWYTVNADDDTLNWEPTYLDQAYTNAGWYSESWSSANGASDPDNWLISPEVTLDGTLSFLLGGVSNWPDHLGVFAVIGWDPETGYAPDESDLISIGEFDCSDEESETTITADLSQFNGQVGRLVFRHYNSYNCYHLYIDDVQITGPAAPWNYEYNIPDNFYTIRGLIPNTKYEVQVQAYNATDASDWCDIVEFTTLRPSVYMLGGDDQGWDPTDGSKVFTYDAENDVYTMTYTFPAEVNYFGFTTELSENNDEGGWAYIEPYRFGAISDGDFWYEGQEYVSLTWDEYYAIRIDGGEYNMTIDLNEMKLYIEPVSAEFLRGDVNKDGDVTISDVTALIDYLLDGNAENIDLAAADCNVDNGVSISDVTTLIDFLLNGVWPE